MSDKNTKLYAVRNDQGEYLSLTDDGDAVWYQSAGNFTISNTIADERSSMGGHVIALVEEPEKVVVSKEEAALIEHLEDNPSDYFPAGGISNFIAEHWNEYGHHNRALDELRLIEALVNGYTVRKEKRFKVKVPATQTSYYYKGSDGHVHASDTSGDLDNVFTDRELSEYGLDGDRFEKVEVLDDADSDN